MRTLLERVYTIVNFAIPSIFILLIGSYFLALLTPQKGEVVCSIGGASLGTIGHKYPGPYTDRQDERPVYVDMDCDVTPLWHWNTKMLYVHIKASFVDNNGVSISETIWDQRISSKHDTHIVLEKAKTNHPLATPGLFSMSDEIKDVKLSVSVSETPYGGKMRYYDVGEKTFPVLSQSHKV